MAKRKLKSKNKNRVKKEIHHDTKLGKFFSLTWRKSIFTVCLLVVLLILRNFSNAWFGIREPVVFLIGIVLVVIYLTKALIYTLVHRRLHSISGK